MTQVMTFSIGVIESDIVSSSSYKRYYCGVWYHHNYRHHHRPIIVKITFYMFLWQVTFVPKLPNWKMETIYTFKMARSLELSFIIHCHPHFHHHHHHWKMETMNTFRMAP